MVSLLRREFQPALLSLVKWINATGFSDTSFFKNTLYTETFSCFAPEEDHEGITLPTE